MRVMIRTRDGWIGIDGAFVSTKAYLTVDPKKAREREKETDCVYLG